MFGSEPYFSAQKRWLKTTARSGDVSFSARSAVPSAGGTPRLINTLCDTALLAARVHGEIFKILTPEQQQKAQDLRKQFESRIDQRRGRGAGRDF